MKAYQIVHDMPGRMRIRYGKYTFSKTAAIGLSYELERWKMVNKVEANDITGSILFIYDKNRRRELLALIRQFEIEKFDVTPYLATIKEYNSYEITQKEVSQNYTSKFIKLLLRRYSIRWFLPTPIQYLSSIVLAVKYFKKGLASLGKGHIDVPVLDATSIAVSMLNRQFKTAGDIMFLLSVSQLLEDYTRKKTTLQLKESLSLHLDKVWILENESEIEIPSDTLKRGDIVIVHMGTMIPVDGEITDGQALINESSFTGEPLSKAVGKDDTVFAGTIVEEGKIYVKVRNLQKESRINKIVDMIDVNETLKAGVQSRAEHLADSIVPFSFFGFFGLLLWTRSLTRATSILLVDYSCAIKLTTSISIISAMQEAGKHSIMVKGGKYLEAMAQADTIVFDKTGTLTNATPFVQEVTPLDDYSRDEVLRIAACLEEHFSHSVANAIVKQAQDEELLHQEEHAEVEYIIAHGIATNLHGQRAIIGSEHFVFDDEQIEKPPEIVQLISKLHSKGASSLIYLAIGQRLAGIISIYDPLKPEAKHVINNLREIGFKKVIMLTGDCENAAGHIANELGIDDYKAGILPEDKAEYIRLLKAEGKKVVMVGDGVNDTPALSSADVSISMQDSSDIARELADVTLTSSRLDEIVEFKKISILLMQRIKHNYTNIVAFNSLLILSGLIGLLQPNTSAFLHNTSTFLFSAVSTKPLLYKKEN